MYTPGVGKKRGRPPTPKRDQLLLSIRFRVTAEEMRAAEVKAKAAGAESVHDFARGLLKREVESGSVLTRKLERTGVEPVGGDCKGPSGNRARPKLVRAGSPAFSCP